MKPNIVLSATLCIAVLITLTAPIFAEEPALQMHYVVAKPLHVFAEVKPYYEWPPFQIPGRFNVLFWNDQINAITVGCPSLAYRIAYTNRLMLTDRTGIELTVDTRGDQCRITATGSSYRWYLPQSGGTTYNVRNPEGVLSQVENKPQENGQSISWGRLALRCFGHTGNYMIFSGGDKGDHGDFMGLGLSRYLFMNILLETEKQYPLTFKLTKDGLVYLCGRGTITIKNENGLTQYILGAGDTATIWLPRLQSKDRLDREAATQALSWLTTTKEDAERAVPALSEVLNDETMEVRRNAAEALGRIGDKRAISALTALEDKEKNEWVREVVKESLALIQMRTAASRLPDKDAFSILTEGLKQDCASVRRLAAQLLDNAGTAAIQSLVDALKDEDPDVRKNSALSLGEIKDKRAIEALKHASTKEKYPEAKKAMESAIGKIQQ